LLVKRKRLEHVIKFKEMAVATLARDDAGSVEHRLEAADLAALIKSRNRLTQGAK
jgi:hypothetical protein